MAASPLTRSVSIDVPPKTPIPFDKEMRMDNPDNWIVFSTEASSYFADALAERLQVNRGNIIHSTFGDGEAYYRIDLLDGRALLGKDIIFVASTAKDADFLELIRIGSAFAGYGVYRRIFVIPFFGYSTMERASKPGEVVTAKVNARMLSSLPESGGGNTFMMMDLHVAGILHYFEGSCLRVEVAALEILIEALEEEEIDMQNAIFASADLGRPKWVEVFATHFGTDMAFVRKTRDMENTAITNVIGEVEGKTVIIYDDMTRSGGTLVHAVDAYIEHGATSVYAVLSHFALTSEANIQRLLDSQIVKLIATNSHQMSMHPLVLEHPDRIRIVDASGEFAKSICAASKMQ